MNKLDSSNSYTILALNAVASFKEEVKSLRKTTSKQSLLRSKQSSISNFLRDNIFLLGEKKIKLAIFESHAKSYLVEEFRQSQISALKEEIADLTAAVNILFQEEIRDF
jgi:hypothetical protein